MIEKFLILFRWIGNSTKSFISTLMTFMWFFLAHFLLKPQLAENIDLIQVKQILDLIMPIFWDWRIYFFLIWISKILYNGYQLYKHEWRYAKGRDFKSRK